MNTLIIMVSLFLIFYVNFCLGEPSLPPPQFPCQPTDQSKSKCLHNGCLCGWCSLPNSTESSGKGELSEHNKNHGPLGECFLYDDSSEKVKYCINATIYTNANSKYCKDVHASIYIFAYIVYAAGAIFLVTIIISIFIFWWRGCK